MEEDSLLNQLDALDSILEGILNYGSQISSSSGKTDNIYNLQSDINTYVVSINDQITELEEKLNKVNVNMEENKKSKESSQLEEINYELNHMYNSLQSLKYMQIKIFHDIKEVESKVDQYGRGNH